MQFYAEWTEGLFAFWVDAQVSDVLRRMVRAGEFGVDYLF